MKEAVEMVKKSRINIGVGTPQRMFDLLEHGLYPTCSYELRSGTNEGVGALSASHLERIIVDASHIDQKKRGILDMKETQVPLVNLLARTEMKERYGNREDGIELWFF